MHDGLRRLTVDVLPHLIMSHPHEPCSKLNLLLEVGGQVLRRAHRLVGGSCRTLSGSSNLGACWRIWRLIHFCPRNPLPGRVSGRFTPRIARQRMAGLRARYLSPSITTWLAEGHSLGWPSAPDGWRVTSNDACFYIAAPALCACDRPCLSDKHPIPANPECKAWQVDVADALARAAPKGGLALVID